MFLKKAEVCEKYIFSLYIFTTIVRRFIHIHAHKHWCSKIKDGTHKHKSEKSQQNEMKDQSRDKSKKIVGCAHIWYMT